MYANEIVDGSDIRETLQSVSSRQSRMLIASANKQMKARPVKAGWALDALLQIDFAKPGLLRFLHTASDLRRQAVFLVLARLDWDRLDGCSPWALKACSLEGDPTGALATALASVRVRDLIGNVFGATPTGLIGALSRCGSDPLEEFNYTLLHDIFDDPKNKPRRALLRHAPKIDDDLVDVVWRLPKALLRPEVLNHIKSSDDIAQYASALNVLRRLHPKISDEDFALSLSQMSPGSSLAHWIRRWIERALHLPPALPFAGDKEMRPLLSASDMKEVARRYQNCLRRRIGDVALGRAAYYEHIDGAIAELRGLSKGNWVLEGIYGPQNRHALPGTVRAIRWKLEGAGVLVPAALAQGPDENAFADVLGLFEFAAVPSLSWEPELAALER